MAIITAIFGFLGRFAGKVLSTTLGWASVLLFGRIPEDRRVRFSALTFGSLVWVSTLIAIVVPKAGVFMISFIPLPSWVDDNAVRLVMIAVALILPAVLAVVALSIPRESQRPSGAGWLSVLARGYLLAPILAGTLVLLAVAGIARKARAVMAHRSSGHVPIVICPRRYDALVDRLDEVLREAELIDGRREGSAVLTGPARLLAKVSVTGLSSLVPDRLQVLTGPDLDVEVYPSDLGMSGSKLARARARAVIMRELDSRDCWFTTTEKGQEIEDQLARVDAGVDFLDPKILADVDRRLATEDIDDGEWDALYRRRLQVAAAATETDIGEPAAHGGAAPARPGSEARPSLGTVVGLVTAGLVAADIALLARQDRNGRH